MPRRRKGVEYLPEIPVLLRDANPTYDQIEDETDSPKRRERKRAHDFAIDCLTKMYRRAEKRGQISQLNFRVRLFCKRLMERNHGRLPDPKGGRPTDEHRRLLIAVHVREAISSRGGKRGAVKQALDQVAEDDGVSYEYVREIHYDRDPEWQRGVDVELACRTRRGVDVELAWRKFLAEG
jgi:hypothetical protein